MYAAFIRFLSEETGAVAVEYGLIATLVSAACIAAFDSLGKSLIVIFQAAETAIGSTTP